MNQRHSILSRNEPVQLSLHAAAVLSLQAAACASALPDGGAPEWAHILPAGTFMGNDGRGPYRVIDAEGLVKRSLAAMGKFGVIDENHSTDLAAPKGGASPAMGFIEGLEARPDGVWAKIAWNAQGKRLLARKAYRGLSPVFYHLKDGTVTEIVRAALVNAPNLRGLAALHQEDVSMNFLDKLRAALKLDAAASEEAILAAIAARDGAAKAEMAAAVTAALEPAGKALSLNAGFDGAAVAAGIEKLKTEKAAHAGDEVVKALQAELKTTGESLNTLKSAIAQEKAAAFVDGAIREGRAGVKPMRDRYIAMHAASLDGAKQVEELISAMPKLNGEIVLHEPPKGGALALNAEQKRAVSLLGVSEADYLKTLEAEKAG